MEGKPLYDAGWGSVIVNYNEGDCIKILIHSVLLSTGFGQSRSFAGSPGLWIVAFYGSYI